MPTVYKWTNCIFFLGKTAVAHIHGGGLSSSIVAKQCGNMAFVERDVQVLNGYSVTIEFAETVEGNAHWQIWEILASLRWKTALVFKKHKWKKKDCKACPWKCNRISPVTAHLCQIPFPLSSKKRGWFLCMMLVKRSPLGAFLFDRKQQHRSAQKERLNGKYHGAGMPYFPAS